MKKIKFFSTVFFTIFTFICYTKGFSLAGVRKNNEYVFVPDSTTTDRSDKNGNYKCDPCPGMIKCVPMIQCPAHVTMKPHEHPQLCELPDGSHGYCCLTGQNHTASNLLLERSAESHDTSDIMEKVMEEARGLYGKAMRQSAHPVKAGQPHFTHHMVFHSSERDNALTQEINGRAMEQMFASRVYKDKEGIPAEDFRQNIISVRFSGTKSHPICPLLPPCHNLNRKYRSADGTCNNPIDLHQLWGAAGQPMERILPPAYEDGIWAPRLHSIDGSLLASPRAISRRLLPDVNRPHSRYNLLLMQFGQFLAHDMTQSSSITLSDGRPIECCTPDGARPLPQEKSHFGCLPIPIEPDDEFYSVFHQGCMNFVRLSLAPRFDCRLGYAKQLSKVTHYLDGSAIYGSDLTKQNELRLFRDGKLRMFEDFGRNLLPLSTDPKSCSNIAPGNACFLAGDGRVNQIISLTAVQVLFAREHNRIADILNALNPHYTDEMIFQEARRIVIAQLQHITYHEWLPLVIGAETVGKFHLNVHKFGYSNDYDVNVNPAVTSEFTAAAFRFGHSTVDGKFKIQKGNEIGDVIDIPDVMFNPSRLRIRNFLDDLIGTLLEQPMQQVDNSITQGLSKFLFRGGNPFGLDLASLNIQRGRDHAIRTYNDYLDVMASHRIHTFDEFGPELAPKLASIYRSPEDIDLWIGGLLESATDDALVGSTFSEIIADQFSRLRRGDRYFYEHSGAINPGFFTIDQLQEIRKASISRIICNNADFHTLTSVPPFGFLRSDSFGNTPVSCESGEIPTIDLAAWKE